jgi:hypothetical protein
VSLPHSTTYSHPWDWQRLAMTAGFDSRQSLPSSLALSPPSPAQVGDSEYNMQACTAAFLSFLYRHSILAWCQYILVPCPD